MNDYPEAVALLSGLKRYVVVKTQPGKDYAYSYLRFSSPPQEEGDSTRRQTSLCDAWLAKHPDVTLDSTLRLYDRGVSAAEGANRLDPKRAMARFLAYVESGRVKAGSFLVVENLDRLTRENPIDAIPWILGLIAKGIKIVALTPMEVIFDSAMDEHRLMMMLWELARGHGESKRKSGLLGQVWAEKKRQARENVPHGRAVPAWIELLDGKYRLIPRAAEAVRTIFRLCIGGNGAGEILRILNIQGVKPFSRGGRWVKSYVTKILENRAAFGEYQPCRGTGGVVPDGEPIPGYFPAAITEAEFYAAQSAKRSRLKGSGRPCAKGGPSSPFAGLLHSAIDGEKIRIRTVRGKRSFCTAAHWEMRQTGVSTSFPRDHLVDGLLSQLAELSAADVFRDPEGSRIQELEGRLAESEKRLAVARERFRADPESLFWQTEATEADRDVRATQSELQTARQAAESPLTETWAEAVRAMSEADTGRLRQALLQTVSEVWCLFVRKGQRAFAIVQVWFAGDAGRRDYLIASRIPTGGACKTRKAGWTAISATGLAPESLDLRDRKQAARFAADFVELDLSAVPLP